MPPDYLYFEGDSLGTDQPDLVLSRGDHFQMFLSDFAEMYGSDPSRLPWGNVRGRDEVVVSCTESDNAQILLISDYADEEGNCFDLVPSE